MSKEQRNTGSHSHLNDEEFGAMLRETTVKTKTETDDQTVNRWSDLAENLLKGKVVSKVRYMSSEEVDDLDWHSRGLVIHLSDKDGENEVCIYPSRDDEGNDSGALFTTDDNLPIIPVIPYWR